MTEKISTGRLEITTLKDEHGNQLKLEAKALYSEKHKNYAGF